VGFIGIGPVLAKGHGILKIKMLAPASIFLLKNFCYSRGKITGALFWELVLYMFPKKGSWYVTLHIIPGKKKRLLLIGQP
jgi:hypothetical protein